MTVNFQEVRLQVQALGEKAPLRQQQLRARRDQAEELLNRYAGDLEQLRYKVSRVVAEFDSSLRCALPVEERLDAHFPPQALPPVASLLAADGSQIAPDRHSQVDYCLINVGAICMQHGGASAAPVITVTSDLLYDDRLYTPTGTLTEAQLALSRDLRERDMLRQLAEQAAPPVISFTDGPMELWGSVEAEVSVEFKRSLKEYLGVLSRLHELNVTTAGYVDKPSANLVVRLLEVAALEEAQLKEVKKNHPLRGVTDIELYRRLLAPGERSAVFAIQSKSAQSYAGVLGLHFFYLNVGRPGHDWLARVEVPAWVAQDPEKLGALQSVLVNQCRVMGSRPYPYLLHRAHEAALVTLEEKEQVTTMIVRELMRREVDVGEISYKQSAKDLGKRQSYQHPGSRGGR